MGDTSERLVDFAGFVVRLTRDDNGIYAKEYYSKQLIRSSGSAALNYVEAIAAGFAREKAHRLSIALRELREFSNNLRIQVRAGLSTSKQADELLDESIQLCKILNAVLKNHTARQT